MKFPSVRSISSVLLLFVITYQFNGCSSSDEPKGPRITSISPTSGPPGTLVKIEGEGFETLVDDNIVKFNGVKGNADLGNATLIMVTAPRSKTGPVTVTTKTADLSGPVFTYDYNASKEYFIKFKGNGNDQLFETGNPGYQGCGDCLCSTMPPLSDEYSTVNICYDGEFEVTGAMIQALKNTTVKFGDDDYPRASFSFKVGDVYYSSGDATQTSASKITITNVVKDGEYYPGYSAYKVTGTVTCKVADSKNNVIEVTEGAFSVRFTERL